MKETNSWKLGALAPSQSLTITKADFEKIATHEKYVRMVSARIVADMVHLTCRAPKDPSRYGFKCKRDYFAVEFETPAEALEYALKHANGYALGCQAFIYAKPLQGYKQAIRAVNLGANKYEFGQNRYHQARKLLEALQGAGCYSVVRREGLRVVVE